MIITRMQDYWTVYSILYSIWKYSEVRNKHLMMADGKN